MKETEDTDEGAHETNVVSDKDLVQEEGESSGGVNVRGQDHGGASLRLGVTIGCMNKMRIASQRQQTEARTHDETRKQISSTGNYANHHKKEIFIIGLGMQSPIIWVKLDKRG
ncbi:hypothetical protein [Gorillibacterium timonense]|uniref:hypothetical protein n=1 Tax=Gorillibacterium timonense TaxID=1689269 RepID=UPI0011DD339A|nr:hypothetical protein [Gorillibacterium timonense]